MNTQRRHMMNFRCILCVLGYSSGVSVTNTPTRPLFSRGCTVSMHPCCCRSKEDLRTFDQGYRQTFDLRRAKSYRSSEERKVRASVDRHYCRCYRRSSFNDRRRLREPSMNVSRDKMEVIYVHPSRSSVLLYAPWSIRPFEI